jgi:hypothetical protein
MFRQSRRLQDEMAGRECRMNNDEFASLLFRHKVLLVAPGAHACDSLALFRKLGSYPNA